MCYDSRKAHVYIALGMIINRHVASLGDLKRYRICRMIDNEPICFHSAAECKVHVLVFATLNGMIFDGFQWPLCHEKCC